VTYTDAEGAGAQEAEDAVEAGWYPDPTRSRKPRERLWDGSAWTNWTRPAEEERSEDEPAGWFHDPESPGEERLWTGSQWTDHRRVALFEAPEEEAWEEEEPVEGPSPLRPTRGVPGWYPDEGRPGIQRYWNGETWTYDAREAPEAPEVPMSTPAAMAPRMEAGPTSDGVAPPEAKASPAPLPPETAGGDPIAQLSELARLHDAGALTDGEFEEAKSKVLRRV
jgi:hypothetical protein